jgi:hypothetical protein
MLEVSIASLEACLEDDRLDAERQSAPPAQVADPSIGAV